MTGQGNGTGPNGGSHGAAPAATTADHAAVPTIAAVLGEIAWLMSQSPAHRQLFIADLEWLIMPPLLLGQFRLFHAPAAAPSHAAVQSPPITGMATSGAVPASGGASRETQRPIGVVLWALVDAEVEARLAAGGARLRPQDWRSGDRLWVVEVIAAAGAAAPGAPLAEAMVADLKRAVFPERKITMRRVVAGKAEVGEV